MNLKIEIQTDDERKFRVDIYDFGHNKFTHVTKDKLTEAVGLAEGYLADIMLLEYHKIKNAWSFEEDK